MKSFKRNFSDAEARVVGYLPLGPQLPGSGTLSLAAGWMGLVAGCMSIAVGCMSLAAGYMVPVVGCWAVCAPLF